MWGSTWPLDAAGLKRIPDQPDFGVSALYRLDCSECHASPGTMASTRQSMDATRELDPAAVGETDHADPRVAGPVELRHGLFGDPVHEHLDVTALVFGIVPRSRSRPTCRTPGDPR